MIARAKQEVRSIALVKRKSLSSACKKQFSAQIATQVLRLPEIERAKTICIYSSLPNEVDTTRIIDALLALQKIIVLPKVDDASHLVLLRIQTLTDLVVGHYGILEPNNHCVPMAPQAVDLFIIPGVAFDRYGNRVGYGKGYYDRLLEDVQVPIVALAFSCQIMETIPHESQDKKVSIIVTEADILRSDYAKEN